MSRVNVQAADNEMSRLEFIFREKCGTNIGRTNHTIRDPIDTGGNVSRVFKVCQFMAHETFCTKVLLVILKIARIFISLAISIRGCDGRYFYALKQCWKIPT